MGKDARRNGSRDQVTQAVIQDKITRNLERENRYLDALLQNYRVRECLKEWIPQSESPVTETTPTGTMTGVPAPTAEPEAAV